MKRIDGLSRRESADLVAKLLRPAVEKSYAHKYENGDLVLWDNRCMLHSASPFRRSG